VSVSLEVARAHQATTRLLEETRRQATRLTTSEEETRVANEELQMQQEELRQTNEELEMQRQALQQQNDDLEEARRKLHEKAEELASVSSYKSQFLANMSHELRTPLNSMLLLSHLLGENEGGNLSGKQVEHARTIHSAGKDLLALINQVLDLAKIESGKQEVHVEPVALAEVAEHAERMFRPLASDKGLRLTIEVAGDVPATVDTDRRRVEQILTNLLGNAIKFTSQGSVTLRIGRPGAGARLERQDADPASMLALAVTDTGMGIAQADQGAVFRAFEQLESRTNRRYGGTGLGLAIARESAVLLGGDIQLESTPGRGSTFTCYIPLKSAADAPRVRQASMPAPVARRGPAPGDDPADLGVGEPHLLIIEDDLVTAAQLVELVHARGMKALVAGEGELGVRLATQHRPTGILLDVRLPDIDGWGVMERLRADPATSAVPVHFVSATEGRARALSMGAIGYLIKPATVRELADVVKMLAPDAGRSAHVLVVEDDADDGAEVVQMLAGADLTARHVSTVRGALDALRSERYACMVLDLGLPDGDGLALLESLGAEGLKSTPPVVVHTARALTREETRRIEEYAEAVVVKDGRSSERLLEEVRLFVHHLKHGAARNGGRRVSPPRGSTRLEGRRILVADDDMRTVYAVSALLRARGAEVLVADTGREALQVLDRNPDIAAVLMDVMMPEMDGYQAMRQLRGDARFVALPVIALTAKAMKGERERCIEAGATDYLAKPVEVERLFEMLDACLPERRADAG
jgi:signal transduction histidine kinase/DNA-binding response OmpR family regulator